MKQLILSQGFAVSVNNSPDLQDYKERLITHQFQKLH